MCPVETNSFDVLLSVLLGRLFVLNLENSTGLMGFREAERACASLPARLASSAELRHAVVECFFSTCTRGWLYGGTVGTTVCNVVGGVLKAVDVKTENATGDAVNLNAFCIKDRDVPCGDPPSFPNARLQEHSGYEMGDELLYTCVPGYVMPSGHKAFSLLCDSCGEWYGMVEICVRDETEGHVDYEDKFPDTYRDGEDREQRAVEARGEVLEEVHAAAHTEGDPSQQHQETTFTVEQARRHMEGGDEEERTIGDFIGLPMPEQEPGVTADEATDAPVSLLSQKHMFWFPSEAFQDDVTQRDSTVQSEESKENESQELNHSQKPIRPDDLEESDRYVYHDTDDHDDHREGHHDADDDHPDLPDQSKSPSKEPVLEQAGGQKLWPGFIPTTTPTSDREQAPTYSWINDLTQQSFVNHDPAPLGPDGVTVMEDHTMHNLPGESGERGEMGGKMGEMGCTGENCPPPASSGQSPKVAAIIVVVCLVAIAVMVGVWCYRRQQQKSSLYEMNGKGQSQSRPAQQMEMQQKV
uniref:Sushi domain containing 5 n=1 Tax=Takifugu rubripes TaxID=31033 RepID=A0A3B5KB11_TAKRU